MRCINWLATSLRPRTRGENSLASAGRKLDDGDIVARFIYSKSQFSKENLRAKPSAFDPSPHASLSVAHSNGLSNDEVWELAKYTLGLQSGRETVYARADLPVTVFSGQGLDAIRDDRPFNRHTSVIGWPVSEDLNEQKQRRKLLCLELSQARGVRLELPTQPVRRSLASKQSTGESNR